MGNVFLQFAVMENECQLHLVCVMKNLPKDAKKAARGQPKFCFLSDSAHKLVVFCCFIAAFFADTVKIVHMPMQLEAEIFGHFFLQLFDARIANFDDFAALKAHKMVVMAVWFGDFVAGNAVAKVDLHGHTGIAQQFERAVHSGLADARIALDHMLIKFFKRVVAGQFKKSFGNDAPLGCGIQPLAVHEIQKIRQAGVIFLRCHSMPTPG